MIVNILKTTAAPFRSHDLGNLYKGSDMVGVDLHDFMVWASENLAYNLSEVSLRERFEQFLKKVKQ